jgi:ABC-type lipoprotein release transport system permease subunit
MEESMRIFSGLKFFQENKKKSIVFLSVIVLAVCVVTIITILINMLIGTVQDYNVSPYQYFSTVITNDSSEISNDVVTEAEQNKYIDNVLSINYDESLVKLVVGGYSRIPIFFLTPEDTDKLLKRTAVKIKEGRLPKVNSHEVALDWRLMANKGLKVGGKIGSLVDNDEVLYGEYTIVGSLAGKTMLSVGSDIYSQKISLKGMLLLHLEKNTEKAEDYVESNFDDSKYLVTSYESQQKFVDDSFNSLKSVLVAIITAVAIILSISVGAFMYIIYVQRCDEFGIMIAIGYSRKFVRNLILKEVTLLNTFSWFIGVVLSLLIVLILNIFIYIPQGVSMNPFKINVLINTLIIPVISALMSIIPLMRYLKKTDPISVIERR